MGQVVLKRRASNYWDSTSNSGRLVTQEQKWAGFLHTKETTGHPGCLFSLLDAVLLPVLFVICPSATFAMCLLIKDTQDSYFFFKGYFLFCSPFCKKNEQ